jgi:hypothetical protein
MKSMVSRNDRTFFYGDAMTSRRAFIQSAVAAPAAGASVPGRIDVQSHLYVPELLDLMESRDRSPRAYRQGAERYVQVNKWVRRVLPKHTDVGAKVADMDAALAELRRSVEKLDFRGIPVSPAGQTRHSGGGQRGSHAEGQPGQAAISAARPADDGVSEVGGGSPMTYNEDEAHGVAV